MMESTEYNSSKIVFVHLPKCAGTATTNALRRALKPGSEYIGLSISTFGHFTAFDTCEKAYRDTIVRSASELPPNADFVYGHLQFQFTKQAYPGHKFLLLMREPRSRLLSQWLYWRSNSDEALAPWGEWGEWVKSARQDYADFLSDPRAFCQTDNVAARLLLQPHPLIPEGKLIEESAFGNLERLLKEALDSIDFVDFVENPFLSHKIRNFIKKPFSYKHENATFIRSNDNIFEIREIINNIDQDVVERMTYLDKFVWRYAFFRTKYSIKPDDFSNECFHKSVKRYLL